VGPSLLDPRASLLTPDTPTTGDRTIIKTHHNTALTSNWPLPAEGIRALVPQPLADELARHPLSRDCHPHGFGYYPKARGHRMRRDHHPDHLVIYCVEGRGAVTVAGKRWPVAAGDMVVLPSGQAHEYRAHRSEPWTIYWMHLGGELTGEYLTSISDDGPVVHLGFHERLLTEFRDLLALPESGFTRPAFIHAANLCKSLLSYAALLRQRGEQRRDDLDLEALHSWMHEHLSERLSLDQLADTAGLSRYHFVRRYREHTGQTPMQAFLHMKVSRACYLLELSDLSVAEVAARFGYEDPYYFSRLFKKTVGISPARYRRRGGAGQERGARRQDRV
jgi:AraC-like DNA-binding protein